MPPKYRQLTEGSVLSGSPSLITRD